MRILEDIRPLLWKEFLDLRRDRKTLITSILMPVILLPLLGLLGVALISQQPVTIAVIDLDRATAASPLLGINISSREIAANITYKLKTMGFTVIVANDTGIISSPDIDLAVIIPRGFAENASSVNATGRIVIVRKATIQAAARAEAAVRGIIASINNRLAVEKIRGLARRANMTYAEPAAFLHPVSARTRLVSITGERVGYEEELRSLFARILVLALSFVVTPAVSYVIDGIIGERERKTIEMLLSNPMPVSTIMYAKLVAATALGLITAVADALGLVAYIGLSILAMGGGFLVLFDPVLLIVHSVVAFFTILVTVTIALPFITRTRGIRSASNIASIITTMGIIVFFTGFIVDYARLEPLTKTILYIIPYTHSILAIQYYVIGYSATALAHILVLASLSIILLYISLKTINTEKLLIAPQT